VKNRLKNKNIGLKLFMFLFFHLNQRVQYYYLLKTV